MKKNIKILLFAPLFLWSLPKDGQVQHGQIQIEKRLQEMSIHQGTANAIIHWQEFSIGDKEKVSFKLPGETSKTLNRVVGDQISAIHGKLNSNGILYLINQDRKSTRLNSSH